MAPLKVLMLSANPRNHDSLRLDEEYRSIKMNMRAADNRDRMVVDLWPAARAADLIPSLLEHKPQIVHFSGHGSSTAELYMLDDAGNSRPVSEQALVRLFGKLRYKVQCVVLNACYSVHQAKAISSVIDCTIGMNSSIGDKSAIVFSSTFYQALAFGSTIQDAFDLAVTDLEIQGLDGDSVPELLIRDGTDAKNVWLVANSVQLSSTYKDAEPTLILQSYSPRLQMGDSSRDIKLVSVRKNTSFDYISQTLEGGRLVIKPSITYLNLIHGGSPISPLHKHYWRTDFYLPALDVKLVNNTGKSVFFHDATVQVSKSIPDYRPIPIIPSRGTAMTLPLENVGWGPMENCSLLFDLLPVHNEETTIQVDIDNRQLPYRMNLGNYLDVTRLRLDEYFENAGVDIVALEKLMRRLPDSFEDSYEVLLTQALGPFPGAVALLIGKLEYTQIELDGTRTSLSRNVRVLVDITGPIAEAPVPPSDAYNILLDYEGVNYRRNIQIFHELREGASDRFLIFLAAERSSVHDFNLVLSYNNTSSLESPPIKLEIFMSKLDTKTIFEANDITHISHP